MIPASAEQKVLAKNYFEDHPGLSVVFMTTETGEQIFEDACIALEELEKQKPGSCTCLLITITHNQAYHITT